MANKGAIGTRLVNWRHTLEQKWSSLRFGEVKIETDGEHHAFEVQVFLDDLDPDWIRVELYADGRDGDEPLRQEMTRVRQLTGQVNGYVYSGSVSATRPPNEYTPRIVAHFPDVAVPLETSQITWQR